MPLIEKIKEVLKKDGGIVTEWGIANAIYNRCMDTPNKANGARVSNIVKACCKSHDIGQATKGGAWFLKDPNHK